VHLKLPTETHKRALEYLERDLQKTSYTTETDSQPKKTKTLHIWKQILTKETHEMTDDYKYGKNNLTHVGKKDHTCWPKYLLKRLTRQFIRQSERQNKGSIYVEQGTYKRDVYLHAHTHTNTDTHKHTYSLSHAHTHTDTLHTILAKWQKKEGASR